MALSTEEKTAIVEEMNAAGMLNYGEVIPVEQLTACFGLEITPIEELEQLPLAKALEVAERERAEASRLGIFVCHWLIDRGRYMKRVHNNYRVLVPSENAGQAQAYLRSAKKKQHRAMLLLKNTPSTANEPSDAAVAARALIAKAVNTRSLNET